MSTFDCLYCGNAADPARSEGRTYRICSVCVDSEDPVDVVPTLRAEIEEFNRHVNAETPFTARIRILRPATKALDADLYTHEDWECDGEPFEVAAGRAVCVVDVYKFGILYCTLPERMPVYRSDWEYLSDRHAAVVEAFNQAYKEGILS